MWLLKVLPSQLRCLDKENTLDGRLNSQKGQVSGTPPGDSLVPIDQGLASGSKTPGPGTIAGKASGLRVTPISAQTEVRQPAVARLWAQERQPQGNSANHFGVKGHPAHTLNDDVLWGLPSGEEDLSGSSDFLSVSGLWSIPSISQDGGSCALKECKMLRRNSETHRAEESSEHVLPSTPGPLTSSVQDCHSRLSRDHGKAPESMSNDVKSV